MVVWIEIAILENFLLDGVLLYLALKCARQKVSAFRLLLASGIGAAEAVVFPLLTLPNAAAYAVKIAGGVLLVAIAVRGKRLKPYLVAGGAFFLLTFALGGMLTALYSFFRVEYAEQGGYIVERAPVGLVLGAAALFAIAMCRLIRKAFRYRREERNLLACVLTSGERTVRWTGYADSGNLLEFRGKPVCVTSAAGIFALFGADPKAEGRIRVKTVNGERDAPVFRPDRLEIEADGKMRAADEVYLTVGEVGKKYQVILSAVLLEVSGEDHRTAQGVAAKDKGKRKRRKLSLRKRSASSAALLGGGVGDDQKTRGGQGGGSGQGKIDRA